MSTKTYHHGDLRHALIEAGLKMIHEEGEEKISLRKVAVKCGVSNAAPYAHFKNKDEFIGAIQSHIMSLFSEALLKAVEENANQPDILVKLGKAYVMFFYRNPLYFDFLFSRKNIIINLSITDQEGNPPLDILKKTAIQMFKQATMPEKVMENKIIAMWALVHGLASIAIMPNVKLEDDLEKRIEEIISSVSIGYKTEESINGSHNS